LETARLQCIGGGTRLPSPAGAQVIVLEAAGRVGGRTASTRLQSAPAVIDIGGQWIGANQPATLQVASEAGVTLAKQYCAGRRVLQIGGSIASYTGLIPSISPGAVIDAQVAIWKLKFLQVRGRGRGPDWRVRGVPSTEAANRPPSPLPRVTAAAVVLPHVVVGAPMGRLHHHGRLGGGRRVDHRRQGADPHCGAGVHRVGADRGVGDGVLPLRQPK
jgi:hypothetical protein